MKNVYRDGNRFCGDIRIDGKRYRKFYATENEAKAFIDGVKAKAGMIVSDLSCKNKTSCLLDLKQSIPHEKQLTKNAKHNPINVKKSKYEKSFNFDFNFHKKVQEMLKNGLNIENTPKLPKLTTEVFNYSDCPIWAQFAAVDKDGSAFFYDTRPIIYDNEETWQLGEKSRYNRGLSEKFDSSDWRHSLIERPKALPEWWMIGKWVYHIGCQKYAKIKEFTTDGFIASDGTNFKLCSIDHFKESRLRPWNGEEMKQQVGLKFISKNTWHVLIAVECTNPAERLFLGASKGLSFDCDGMLNNYTMLDGSPCGVLEHKKNGEWVK